MSKRTRPGMRFWMLAVSGALLAGLAPAAIASGERLVVTVPEPFVVNGQTFPAGVLALRQVSDYTPGTTLDEITVGVERVGLLLAELVPSETLVAANAVMFRRNEEGLLVLLGYVLRHSGPDRSFLYRSVDRKPLLVAGDPVLAAADR